MGTGEDWELRRAACTAVLFAYSGVDSVLAAEYAFKLCLWPRKRMLAAINREIRISNDENSLRARIFEYSQHIDG